MVWKKKHTLNGLSLIGSFPVNQFAKTDFNERTNQSKDLNNIHWIIKLPLLKKKIKSLLIGPLKIIKGLKFFFHMSNYSVNAVLIKVISWFFPKNFVYNFDF